MAFGIGQAIGGLVGLGGGLIADALDNSEEEAERERIRNQRLALAELQGAKAWMPTINRESFDQARQGAVRMAQHGAGGPEQQRAALYALSRKKPEEEGGY